MGGFADIARLLRLDRWALASGSYSARQVRTYLRALHARRAQESERIAERDAERIRRVLETVPTLVREPRVRRRYHGFDRYLEQLPKILVQYSHGKESREIAAELHFLATEYGVEAVIDITAQVVAERLSAAPA